MVHQEIVVRATARHGEMHDLTAEVARVIAAAGVRAGIAHVFVMGSTAAIALIEFEPGLQQDLPALLDRLIPPSRSYAHEQTWHDGNGHSHLQATWLGQGVTLPVREGAPALGRWQQVVLLECDIRPRRREIAVTVIGE